MMDRTRGFKTQLAVFVTYETKRRKCMRMDRRIKKSRSAIYQAFLDMLNEKAFEKISVQEVIERADVGRSTFYKHYESKEALLEQLCQDLIQHIFVEGAQEEGVGDELEHLFYHFWENQHKIATLLLSNNEYFIRRLQDELEKFLYPLLLPTLPVDKQSLPESFLKNSLTRLFLDTVIWRLKERKDYSDQDMAVFYRKFIG